MNWPLNLSSWILFLSALISLGISWIAWQRRTAPGARALFLMLLTTTIWAGANGLFFEAATPQTRLFWFHVLMFGSLWGTPAFLIFALQYTGHERWLTPRHLGLICLIPILAVLMNWTNDWHQLFFAERDFTSPRPTGEWPITPGIGYQIYLLYGYSAVIFSIVLITQAFFRSPRLYRGQTGTILFGTLIPLTGNVIYNTILNGPEKGWIDPTPILFTVMGVVYAFGLFNFRLFDIVPVARHAIVENMSDGVLVVDVQNRIVDINPAGISLLALSGSSPIGFPLNQLPITWPDQVPQFLQNTHLQCEIIAGPPPARYFELHIEPLFGSRQQAKGHLIVFRDITKRKQDEEALQNANLQLHRQLEEIEKLQTTLHEQAIHDALTGLFNRRFMDDVLKRESFRADRHQHPLSILMIEVDSFKNFNDTYGHDAGDLVLRQVAELMRDSTRTDDIACRFGGDEFVLILPETPLEAARLCAERVRANMANLHLEYQELRLEPVTLSIGVASFPQHGETVQMVLRASDKAMYQAKQAGKNRVVTAFD